MMALKEQGRWAEADLLARAVRTIPAGLVASEDRCREFGKAPLAELRLRTAYMSAIFYVDRFADIKTAAVATAAKQAADALAAEIALPEHHLAEHDHSLYVAAKLVVLCHSILGREEATLDDVLALLKLDSSSASRVSTGQPALGAVSHYDAACAVSLLLERPGPTDNAAAVQEMHVLEGCRLLRLALAATGEQRRVRVRTMAQTDAMLEELRRLAPVEFDEAIGTPPEPPAPDARLALDVTTTASPVAS
jgi:hypothetical protein